MYFTFIQIIFAIFILIRINSIICGIYLFIEKKYKYFYDFRINSNKFKYLWYLLIYLENPSIFAIFILNQINSVIFAIYLFIEKN